MSELALSTLDEYYVICGPLHMDEQRRGDQLNLHTAALYRYGVWDKLKVVTGRKLERMKD